MRISGFPQRSSSSSNLFGKLTQINHNSLDTLSNEQNIENNSPNPFISIEYPKSVQAKQKSNLLTSSSSNHLACMAKEDSASWSFSSDLGLDREHEQHLVGEMFDDGDRLDIVHTDESSI